MTPKQQARIDQIKQILLARRYGSTAASYEIKRFEIQERDDSDLVFLAVESGLIGDEGTMAALLARDYRLIMVGPAGGVELLNPKKKGRTINRGLFHVLNNLV